MVGGVVEVSFVYVTDGAWEIAIIGGDGIYVV